MSQRNNEVLGDFIEIYKSEPCLWKVKDNDYRNRDQRDAAYRKLVNKLKEIEPDANETLVKKKSTV
ncbi:unnamed protein product [Acanthoscelides obtectus]|uniref:MADF domain-containing protein n=1 Tax=Acanthoscelides obtectus TaxID=200917 RepID=A0A9P0NXC6_ACAOB|nr:unnamed protein product [Acanthoscelides obtectus]CAK1662098.1 hypothetical protein AOBTE_LOCUS22984 [Acanthoscelides obtectus]